jgi:fluoride ion exporter CrcB/FEX
VLLVSVLRINENNFLNDRIGCAWIIALEYGFCGCLSTVSSFVYELDKLPVRYAYRYFCASILIGLLTCFAIVGSYKLAGNSVSSCDNNILIF